MSYADFTARQRRLTILQLLRKSGDAANEHVLLMALRELGYPATTFDMVRADIDALRDRSLILVEWFDDRQAVATLTERGVDVAAGRLEVEGVAKPARVG